MRLDESCTMMAEATATARANHLRWRERESWSGERDHQSQPVLKLLAAWDNQEVDLAEIAHSLGIAYIPSNYGFGPKDSKQISPFTQGCSAMERERTYPAYIVFLSPESGHEFFTIGSLPEAFTTVRSWPAAEAVVAPAAEHMNIARQLDALKKLKDGWADGTQFASRWGEGYGIAPDAERLNWLASRFSVHYAPSLPRPYLYPTPEGGVQAEWSLGPNEASLEIDLATHSGEWHCLDLHTGHSTENMLALDHNGAWEWLASELLRLEATTE